MADEDHDIAVIGGGPGGYATAFRGAARGLEVAVVERDRVGGTCLHSGCIPSKANLHVAGIAAEIDRADQLGLRASLDGVDGDALAAFRRGVIDRLHDGLRQLVERRCVLHRGTGRVAEPGVVAVDRDDGGTAQLRARHVVLATGSVPGGIPGVSVDGEVVCTSDQALWFREPPERAVIVGAGAVGVEFASMWRPLGSQVTVVEALDRVLPVEDPDVSAGLERAFDRRGIGVLTGTELEGVEVTDDTARVRVVTDGQARELVADRVLIAVGRRPATGRVGARELGVLDDDGYVASDALGRTAVDGLWAVGDVRPTLALAHAAFAEGFAVADAVAGSEPPVAPVDHVHVPRVTYCHPEVASVGLTEPAARQRHGRDAVVTERSSLGANAKGILADSGGFVKVVAVAEGPGVFPGATGEILGVHVVGPQATDVIAEATLATAWGALPEELAAITHAHPTLYEAMGEAFQAVAGVPFHHP